MAGFKFKTAQSGRESSKLLTYAKNAGKFFATISGFLPAMALTAAVCWGALYCVNKVEAYALKLPGGFKEYFYKPAWDFLDKSAQNCLFKSMEWMLDPFMDTAEDVLNEASSFAETTGYSSSADKNVASENEKLIKDKGSEAVSSIVTKDSSYGKELALTTLGSIINMFKVPGKEYEHARKQRESIELLSTRDDSDTTKTNNFSENETQKALETSKSSEKPAVNHGASAPNTQLQTSSIDSVLNFLGVCRSRKKEEEFDNISQETHPLINNKSGGRKIG